MANLLIPNLAFCKGVLAGVPFFDEVFRQLDCVYGLNPFSVAANAKEE